MKRFLTFSMLLLATLPAMARGKGLDKIPDLTPQTCDALASVAQESDPARQRADVAVFDHAKGELLWPAPAKLEVADGQVFVVVFTNTDPTLFDYSIKALDDDQSKEIDLKVQGKGVPATQSNAICVSWRHHEEFAVYKVAVTRRVNPDDMVKAKAADVKKMVEESRKAGELSEDAAKKANDAIDLVVREPHVPGGKDQKKWRAAVKNFTIPEPIASEIDSLETVQDNAQGTRFPYTFPVWVETTDAVLSFSTGFAFSDLASDRFFIKTTKVTDAAGMSKDVKTVERDRSANDKFRPDLMAYATVTMPRKKSQPLIGGRLGLTFGLGIGEDKTPRYFIGPSFVFSHRVVLSVGAVGAQVKRLPAGQKLGEAPINGDNTLNTLDSRFKIGYGLNVSFQLGKSKQDFLGVLNPPQKVPEKPKEK